MQEVVSKPHPILPRPRRAGGLAGAGGVPTMAAPMSTTSETLRFQAEASEVLGLMIHSLYRHREIFLRELVSNASDALDKRRFEALTRPELGASEAEARIRIELDAAARTLTVHDGGIG